MNTGEMTQVLDDLLDALEVKLSARREQGRGDAIDAVLSGRSRTTAVHSLREAAEVQAFRQALMDGLIRVDTANKLLSLVNELVVRLIP